MDKALDLLGQAALLNPSLAEAHAALGAVLQQAGRTEAARQAYEHALDVDPGLAEVRNAVEKLPPRPPQRTNFTVGQVLVSSRGGHQGTTAHYTVLAVRKGGFGAVYIVQHSEGKQFALKSFDAQLLWSDEDHERFLREAATWISLDPHPNVVTAQWVETIEGFPCLVMEYVSGGDLGDRLDSGRLRVRKAVKFGIQICDGMEHVSRQLELVHRDLKPSNCMVTREDVVKVTDFGLARALRQAQETSLDLSGAPASARALYTTVAGTPAYMPPEQFIPGAELRQWSDVYAFGVMLFQMLTCELPQSDGQAKAHIANSRAARRIPRRLMALILQCVEQDPSRRPSTFAEVRSLLEETRLGRTRKSSIPKARGTNPDTCLDRSIAYRHLGQPDQALAEADRGLAMTSGQNNVEDSKLWQVRGLALVALNRRPDALASYDRAIALNPLEPSLWVSKGGALAELGRDDEALECYKRCLEIAPDYSVAWRNMATSLGDLDRFDEAEVAFQRAVQMLPTDVELLANWAAMLCKQGRPAEALRLSNRALEIAPRDEYVWFNRSNILSDLGRFQDALVSIDRVIEINPDYTKGWANRALVLHELDRHDDAIKSCDRALSRTPDDPRTLEIRAWLSPHSS